MSRLLGLLVLLLVAVLLVPALRERAAPQIDWALGPLYRWETKNRLNEIHRVLAREHATGGTLPSAREFPEYLRNREGEEAVHDRWGEPFFLEVDRGSFRVGSAGPDREQGTGDDIFSRPFRTGGP